MGEPGGARDVDAAMDGVDPGGAGIGDDDAGGAEDRKAADHAQARIQRPLGDLLSAWNGDFHRDIHRLANSSAASRTASRIIARGHGVDRGLARRNGKAGPRHGADARTRAEGDAASKCPARHARNDERAMRHIGVVARVLDDAGARPACAGLLQASAKLGRMPFGRVTATGSGKPPPNSAWHAARAAAAAHVPVVQPRRRAAPGFASGSECEGLPLSLIGVM